MNRCLKRGIGTVVLGLEAALGTIQGLAADFTLDAGYEARATDNVGLVSEGEQNDVVHTPFLRLAGARDGSWLDASANYEYRRRIFQDGSFRNDFVVNGSGSLTAELAPRRLFWDVTHTRTQALADLRFVNNPLNQQEINTIGTGLAYQTPEGRRNQLLAEARFEDQRSSLELNASQRSSVTTSLTRSLSPRTRAGVRVQGQDVDFREDVIPDFQRLDTRIVASREGPRLRLELTGGLNWVDRDGLDVTDGFAASADLEVTVTPTQRLTFTAEERLADQTNFAVAGIPDPGTAPQQGIFGNVFELRTAQLRYTVEQPRTRLQLELGVTEQDFDVGPPDLSSETASISWTRRVARGVRFAALVTFRRQEFGGNVGGQPPRDDEILLSRASLEWDAGPRTRVSVGVRYDDSESTADFFNFTERSLLFSFERRVAGPPSRRSW